MEQRKLIATLHATTSVVFGEHHVLASCIVDLLGDFAIAEQHVTCETTPRNDHAFTQSKRSARLVGLVVCAVWSAAGRGRGLTPEPSRETKFKATARPPRTTVGDPRAWEPLRDRRVDRHNILPQDGHDERGTLQTVCVLGRDR
jgi:hypothetical protein